ncbi:ribbon-helix-helix domain-containing protein [Thermoanaerobacterium sp. DL9XJH110]|uniref:ribbon-helix-helix domain-containing protein n=1 Tax=Thermoanaerobacterium sp. DL9XJH110 TaxID=3386643 RepID=UPI003BB75512
MRKTMVYLNEEQFFALKQIAKQSNRKMAELIREAVDNLIREKNKNKNYFRFVGIGSGEVNGRTSENVDEVLKEVFK